MVIRGANGELLWLNPDGSSEPYTGQDGASVAPGGAGQGAPIGSGTLMGSDDWRSTQPPPPPVAQPTEGAAAPAAPGVFDPRNPVVGARLPGTNRVYVGKDDITGVPKFIDAGRSTSVVNGNLIDSETGEVLATFPPQASPTAGVSAATSAASAAAQRALDWQKFVEQMGAEKAKFNAEQEAQAAARNQAAGQFGQNLAQRQAESAQQQRQFEANLGADRERTLLNLGSRPDTLTRYLYALRGQLTPQQLGGAAPPISAPVASPAGESVLRSDVLPTPGGLTDVVPFAAPVEVPRPAAPAPLASSTSWPGQPAPPTNMQQSPALADLLARSGGAQTPGVAPWLVPQTQKATAAQAPQTLSVDVGAAPTGRPVPLPTAAGLSTNPATEITGRELLGGEIVEHGRERVILPLQQGGGYQWREFDRGGLIAEPILGIGMHSGTTYMMGENAPAQMETVVPEGKSVADVKGKSGKRRGNTKSYAQGGALGYSMDYDPKVFNPPNLAEIVQRGYNSTPAVPLLPQVPFLTGGGESLIPSAQRLSQALPSEREAYSGFLQDEAGVQSGDVFDLARRLAPRATNIRTPRFAS